MVSPLPRCDGGFVGGGGGRVGRAFDCDDGQLDSMFKNESRSPPCTFRSRRYYLTANSCIHEGYESYTWPDGWPIPSSMMCEAVSDDGTGVPEQFW